MQAYKVRRRKFAKHTDQSRLPFSEVDESARGAHSVAVESPGVTQDDFSFTLAIGPQPQSRENEQAQMEIDVSAPVQAVNSQNASRDLTERYGLFPVATLEERRIAGVIDAACLLFAYGGFMTLFGSLGGQFTVSKLSAAVYAATVGIVYLQYFALFTIFGGTTPGMMFRGLQVTSFTGDPPTPRQMLLRSLGYIFSAGTLFLGFFWACWDEDSLTWHDRLSRTYLSAPAAHGEMESPVAAHSPGR